MEGQHQTLVEAALEVLNEPDRMVKAQLGESAAFHGYRAKPHSLLTLISIIIISNPPDRTVRLSSVKLVTPQMMPKLRKDGSLDSRQAMLHSLVHMESWAIDLSWDIIARFGRKHSMPRDFFTDFVRVAQDEGRHFTLLNSRLQEIGSFYGAFPDPCVSPSVGGSAMHTFCSTEFFREVRGACVLFHQNSQTMGP